MVGVAPGEARLTLEAGATRLVTTVRMPRGPVTSQRMHDALPVAVASLERQLDRIKAREVREE